MPNTRPSPPMLLPSLETNQLPSIRYPLQELLAHFCRQVQVPSCSVVGCPEQNEGADIKRCLSSRRPYTALMQFAKAHSLCRPHGTQIRIMMLKFRQIVSGDGQ